MNPDEDDSGFMVIDLDAPPGGAPPEVVVEPEEKPQAKPPAPPKEEPEGDEEEELKPHERKRPSRNDRLKLQRDRAFEEAKKKDEELTTLKARLAALEENQNKDRSAQIDYSLSTIEDSLKRAKAQLKQAIEAGNAEDIADLQGHITELTWDKKTIESAKARIPAPNAPGGEKPPQTTPPSNAPQAQRMHPKLTAWVEDNDWFKKSQPMRAAAIAVDAELRSEGFQYEDDDFYEELDKRLDGLFPDRFGKVEKKTSPVSGGSRNVPGSPSKSIKLSKEEVERATKLGVSLQEYARRKAQVDNSNDDGYTVIL